MSWDSPREWEICGGKYKRFMWLCKKLGTKEAAWHHKGGPTSLQSLQGDREGQAVEIIKAGRTTGLWRAGRKSLRQGLWQQKTFKVEKFEIRLWLELGCCWTVTQAVLKTLLTHFSSSSSHILDHSLKKAQSTSHWRITEEFPSTPSSCTSLNSCERTASSSMCQVNLHHTTKHVF